MLYEITNGRISGRYEQPQEGKTLIAESHASVKAALKAESDALLAKQAQETTYAYARARAQAYVQNFSKDPKPNPVDVLGHVVDAILAHLSGDVNALTAILEKRAEIKAANPKA